jgi:PadR family transcriptional regulator PadR
VGGENEFELNWSTQLRKGTLELCLLNALSARRLYGYELVRRLSTIDSLVISEGTVYPILSRLKREGFVTSSIEESPDGPARKYYDLTERGRRQLQRMNEYWRRLQSGVQSLRQGS